MKTIKVTPETLETAKEELKNFLQNYDQMAEKTGGHLTTRAISCMEKATKANDVKTFRNYLEYVAMELGILAQIFGLDFEF